jgi:serine/threonine protein kinase
MGAMLACVAMTSLPAGRKLGPYEIVSPLGAGGMGEVYRARDGRLGRDVAIKVLPAAASSSAEALARFEREARAVSQLSDPNICALFDVGEHDGVRFLVMELLDGETLAARLERGPISGRELLRIAIQIADGLHAAHRIGLVHRDLKPANVMLTRTGAKLLDFGLARTASPASIVGLDARTVESTKESNVTAQGTIVGTLRYMAPEQLEEGAVDPRTDIHAFGTLLHEMATGKPVFDAKSRASLIAAILKEPPPSLAALAPATPPALARIVERCLAKDPDDRWQSMRDVSHELRWIEATGAQEAQSGSVGRAAPSRRALRFVPWAAAGIFAMLAVILGIDRIRREEPRSAPIRFEIPLPTEEGNPFGFAFSPDGRHLAFVVSNPPEGMLYLRALDGTDVRLLPGTEGAMFPFWSPDGNAIAFFARGKLMRFDLATGQIQTLAEAGDGRGGSWSTSGDIIYAAAQRGNLRRISSRGGPAVSATELDVDAREQSHRWPWFLPDGRHFLFSVRRGVGEPDELRVAEIDKPGSKSVLTGTSRAEYIPSGHLLYVSGSTLHAHAFDLRTLEVRGDPTPIEERVEMTGEMGPTAYGAFSASSLGMLAFAEPFTRSSSRLIWFDRSGSPIDTVGEANSYDEPALSPDGEWVAVDMRADGKHSDNIWLVDLRREVISRLTFDAASDVCPMWSPDGKRVAFSSLRNGYASIFEKRVDEHRPEVELLNSTLDRELECWTDDWSRDGRFIAFEIEDSEGRFDVHLLPMSESGPGASFPLLDSPFQETHARVSPNSKWIAYTSNETGRAEIYVQSFPELGQKRKISERGGDQACWRRDGKELFFLALDRTLMSVAVTTEGTFETQTPRALFRAPTRSPMPTGSRNFFEPAPDGKSFLVCSVVEKERAPAIVVRTDWDLDLPGSP